MRVQQKEEEDEEEEEEEEKEEEEEEEGTTKKNPASFGELCCCPLSYLGKKLTGTGLFPFLFFSSFYFFPPSNSLSEVIATW